MTYNNSFPKSYDEIKEVGFLPPSWIDEDYKDEYKEINFFDEYENNNLDMENYASDLENIFQEQKE